ncbi:M55 family metallopeptidase [candidate division KSB1 bacterium]
MIKKRNIILILSLTLLLTNILSVYSQKPNPTQKKKLKIYMLTDLEGAAGVVTFQNHSYSTGKYYEQSKNLFTKELNAAVEGALDAGATEIVIWDGHGSGGINFELIHPEAKVIMGSGGLLGLDESFDAMLIIGQHAMSNTPNGNLAHSYSSRTIENIFLNGKPIGETGIRVILASYYNIPTVFLSGDKAACDEFLKYVTNGEVAPVKIGFGLNVALNLSPVKARELIKEKVKKSLLKIHEIKKYWVPPPYELVIEYKTKNSADNRAKNPDWEKIDELKVIKKADDYLKIAW